VHMSVSLKSVLKYVEVIDGTSFWRFRVYFTFVNMIKKKKNV